MQTMQQDIDQRQLEINRRDALLEVERRRFGRTGEGALVASAQRLGQWIARLWS